jgi:two-component system, chemotaxis family, chemotaxis protein CheY
MSFPASNGHRHQSKALIEEPPTAPSLTRVLVVDDSEMLQTMYRLVLRRYEGCEVVIAGNGVEALERLGGHFDLILLDINMPVMGGLQFLQALKDRGQALPAPVIVVSTEGQDNDIGQAMALGAKAYLVKPFKSSRLHELIGEMMGGV